MGKRKLFYYDAKLVRTRLSDAIELAQQVHERESQLIRQLYLIDRRRFFVARGHKSLSAFCLMDLGFTKTQTQRLVTQVRRFEPNPSELPLDNPHPRPTLKFYKMRD
jgi:hypothetical protein